MEQIGFVYDSEFKRLDYGSGHIMRGDRYERARQEFSRLGLLSVLSEISPRPATEEELALFHTPETISRVKSLNHTRGVPLGPDTPTFPGIFDAASLSVGASLTAAEVLLRGEFDIAGNICGGWHHAFEDSPRGFCIFNDIVVTARYLLAKGVKKILILDYDAHHGDGTQRAFYEDPRVLTISIHQDPNTLYPYRTGFPNERGKGKGEGFNFNCPMPPYATDTLWLKPFETFLPEVLDLFAPDFILLQMGVDAHCDCVISHLHVSLAGYQKASQFVAHWVRKRGKKLLYLGGGGFVHPMLGRGWGIQLAEFANISVPLNTKEDAAHCAVPPESYSTPEVENYLREHLVVFRKAMQRTEFL